jgi:AcrR family transcriptional regulator
VASTGAAVGLREERRRQRMQTSRNHILDVAEALFSEQGYHSTSLDQVASGSEYSVGSLYTFFAGKQELLAAVLRRRENEMWPAIEAIQDAALCGLEELLALCVHSVDYMTLHPAFAKLSMRVYQAGLESIPAFGNFRLAAADERPFARAVRKGQADGTIREGDVVWLALLVEGMIMFDRLARAELPAGTEPTGNLVDVLTDALRAKTS